MNVTSRTKTVAIKVSPEQRMVLAFLSEETKTSQSTLIYDALLAHYDFAALLPLARSFFASSVRLIEQTHGKDDNA